METSDAHLQTAIVLQKVCVEQRGFASSTLKRLPRASAQGTRDGWAAYSNSKLD